MGSKINRKYGFKKGLSNFKFQLYRDVLPQEVTPLNMLPASVNLRQQCLPVYDQLQEGSCTANALVGAVQFLQPLFLGSRQFLYYNERSIEGDTNQDGGAQISSGVTSLMTTGLCSEQDWPYDMSQLTVQPSPNCYTNAKKDVITQALRITSIQEMKSCLAQGFPFAFGFSVYESFEGSVVASTGIVPMPQPNEECLGGHAVLCCGYDDTNNWFIVKNSWGTSWGASGFFFMPYSYMENNDLVSDFWTLRK